MKKLESFTSQHPIATGFLLVVLFSLLSTLTWPIAQLYPYPEGFEVSEAWVKILMAAFFIALLWRFGWLKTAGFLNFGENHIWRIVTPLIIYKIILSVYIFSGTSTFGFPNFSINLPLFLAIIFFFLATSLLEESMYRGFLLTAMLKSWGATRRGILLSAIVSGVFWGSMHFFNLIVRPFPVVFFQVLYTSLVGFYYAIFTISGRSIWPAIVFHWAINASVNLVLNQNPAFEETITLYIWLFVISLLPLLVSLWMLRPSKRLALAITTS